MSQDISNSDNTIDSRDVIARIEELTDEIADAQADIDNPDTEVSESAAADIEELRSELRALEALQSEAEGYAADWQHGETLIRDSYFKTYAQELADDIGAVPRDLSWPATCIDWDQAARELQMDYTSVDFDGVTYWVR
jgi:hypothetical protein